jgi:GNAT superfamily N-acetyltransferase
MLHWVAVKPGHQGKRIGKAIIAETVALIHSIEGDLAIYLGTQTWSHKAVGIYEWAGFAICREPGVLDYANDSYEEAVRIIKSIRGTQHAFSH